jgi:hypothetical protein
MLHVELIQNEWSAAQQRVVARLTLNGSGVHVDPADDDHWTVLALRPFIDPITGTEVRAEEEPDRFLRGLHHHLNGDYVFATEAHEEGECEFALGTVVPLKVTGVGESAAAHHSHAV